METRLKVNTNKKDIMTALKVHTRPQHAQIEENPLTSAIMKQEVRLIDYVKLIKKYYGFYKAVEDNFANCPDWRFYDIDLFQRQKTQALHEDLYSFGLSNSKIQEIPLCQELPPMKHFAEQWGVMYVLEGATLGGQIISRHIKQKLPISSNRGGKFFEGYGNNTGLMWKRFKESLERYAELNKDQHEKILESARLTFFYLDKWLKMP